MPRHTCSNMDDPTSLEEINDDINHVILLTGQDNLIHCFNIQSVISGIQAEGDISKYRNAFLGDENIKLSNTITRTELLTQLRTKGGEEGSTLADMIAEVIPDPNAAAARGAAAAAARAAATPARTTFFLFLKDKIECLKYINENIKDLQGVTTRNNARNETCRFYNLRPVVVNIRTNLANLPQEEQQEILALEFEGYAGMKIKTFDQFLRGCLGEIMPGAPRAMVPCLLSIIKALQKFYETNRSHDSPNVEDLTIEQFRGKCDFISTADIQWGGKRRNRTNRKRSAKGKGKNKKYKSRKN